MDNLERARDGREAVQRAEADGRVADSYSVRRHLLRKVHSGEMTLKESQAELNRIKRNAKRNGQVTRSQASRGA